MARGDPAPPKDEAVNLGDAAGIKRRLDDVAAEVVTGNGYLEDYRNSNIKVLLGVLTVGTALVAQFWPGKYPDTWPILLTCVVLYCILSTLLTWFTTNYEGDAVLITKPPRVGGGSGLRLISRMPRFSDMYTLEIADKAPDSKPLVSLERSVTKYFYSDGLMAEEKFQADVQALLDQYLEKKGK